MPPLKQNYTYGQFSASPYANKKTILVSWHSSEGRNRLLTAQPNDDFYILSNFFQPQIHPTYCGIASAVIVLNALFQPLNQAPTACHIQKIRNKKCVNLYLYAFLQTTFLGKKTDYIKEKEVIEFVKKTPSGEYQPGLSLDKLADLLHHYKAKVKTTFAKQENELKLFRSTLLSTLAKQNHYIIIHFRCDYLGGLPSGHISPICAYHQASDSVLVLDVAAHKTPWYWAPLKELYQSMQESYGYQVQGGGYLQVTL
ncbi:phytochelatin synthase family protein [uncultured Shewanella sp.]|uniref:phytochelatin synthase family protein n=1 Tax=uncultured Shewanella sp. TaxID=173975 RepID=UPI0026134AAF|nr:phytochelatin synthase family protein [uncultured Shewanella sp.]